MTRTFVPALCVLVALASSAGAGGVPGCVVDEDCDDGLFCTGAEACFDGQCVGLSACPPFIDGCVTSQGCDEETDTCLVGPDDSLCDDGLFCNGTETCDGETKSCVAVSACPPFIDGCVTSQGCDEETDTCLVGPDDSLCEAGEVCLPSGDCVTTTTSTLGTTTTTSSSATTSSSVASSTTSTSSSSTTSTSETSSTTTSTVETSTTTSSSTIVTTTTSSTTTTAPSGTTVFPPGTKLLVRQKRSGAQRLQLLAKGPEVATALPCETDGELAIEAVGAGASVVRFALEAGLWKPLKAKKPEQGCKYRKGLVVATVQLKTGKMLKVAATAPDLGLPLATDPRPVRIELRHGEVRHCVEFGGEGKHKPDKKLLANKADPAAACPAAASPSGAFMD